MHKTFLMSFSDKRDDRRTAVQRYNTTYIDPPLDKRYSPIISSICGPNNYKETKMVSKKTYEVRYLRKQIESDVLETK